MVSKSSKVIVFDFDGVVVDSTEECMLVSWNAWSEYIGETGRKVAGADNIPEYWRHYFTHLRPRVRGAGEYLTVYWSYENSRSLKTQQDFDAVSEELSADMEVYKEIFYQNRALLMSNDLDAWIKLHRVSEEVVAFMGELADEDSLFVATLKDGPSVRRILESYGVSVPDEKFYDQSKIKTKLEALKAIEFDSGLTPDNIYFIDDNITHLLDPKASGFSTCHAAWFGRLDDFVELANLHDIPSLASPKLFKEFVLGCGNG